MFVQTITKVIKDYRFMLRKIYKGQQLERVKKLHEMGLKDPKLNNDPVALFHVAHAIVNDLQQNHKPKKSGYYAYSGVIDFCGYVVDFLDDFEVNGDVVVHKAQEASQAMLSFVQSIESHSFDSEFFQKAKGYNEVVARCGSNEQQALYKKILRDQALPAPVKDGCIDHFEACIIKELIG